MNHEDNKAGKGSKVQVPYAGLAQSPFFLRQLDQPFIPLARTRIILRKGVIFFANDLPDEVFLPPPAFHTFGSNKCPN
jgi:hypothetical protein